MTARSPKVNLHLVIRSDRP